MLVEQIGFLSDKVKRSDTNEGIIDAMDDLLFFLTTDAGLERGMVESLEGFRRSLNVSALGVAHDSRRKNLEAEGDNEI